MVASIKVRDFYPVLIAIYPVLHRYSHNIEDVYFPWIVFAVAAATAAILVLTLTAACRDAKRGSLLAAIGLIWLIWCYQVATYLLKNTFLPRLGVGTTITLLAITAVFVLAAIWLMLTRVDLSLVSKIFGVLATVWFGLSCYTFVAAAIQSYALTDAFSTAARPVDVASFNIPESTAGLPNIVYVVSDGRASSAILQEYYEYSDSEFTSALEDLGFSISDNSVANYGTTVMSLAASLNMDYIKYPADLTTPKQKYGYLVRQVRNSYVARALQSLGYQYVHVASGYRATNNSPIADLVLAPERVGLKSEFVTELLRFTMLCRSACTWLGHDWYRDRIEFPLNQLDAFSPQTGPMFMLVHIMSPHSPFVFDRNGNVPESESNPSPQVVAYNASYSREAYLEQTAYTDKRLIAGMRSLIDRMERPTVIILQSDHGPAMTWSDAESYSDKSFLRERMFIMNAYYLPGESSSMPQNAITPVNSFRYIFNRYLGADLKMLPDKSYRSYYPGVYDQRKFDYVDITAMLRGREEGTVRP